jgi:hypothetical protein
MSVYDMTVTKIRQLPESLIQEVSDFVDFLLMRQDATRWQLWNQFTEALELSESGFSDTWPDLKTMKIVWHAEKLNGNRN